MMLIARQICYSSEGIHGSYAIWLVSIFFHATVRTLATSLTFQPTWFRLHEINKFFRFKATFGELKYYLKADEFTFTIQTMMNMIEYENDKDILQVKREEL